MFDCLLGASFCKTGEGIHRGGTKRSGGRENYNQNRLYGKNNLFSIKQKKIKSASCSFTIPYETDRFCPEGVKIPKA